MDLNKEIQFPGKGKAVMPRKRYMNLAQRDVSLGGLAKAVPLALLLAVLVFAVFRFGVADRLELQKRLDQELAMAEQQREAIGSKTKGFDALADEYKKYGYNNYKAEEAVLADRMELIAVINRVVLPKAHTDGYTIEGNKLNMKLLGINLQGSSELLAALNAESSVASVSIAEAGSDNEKNLGVTISIVFKDNDKIVIDQPTPPAGEAAKDGKTAGGEKS